MSDIFLTTAIKDCSTKSDNKPSEVESMYSCDDHSGFAALCNATQIHMQKGFALKLINLLGK